MSKEVKKTTSVDRKAIKAALQFTFGFELPGNKELDTRYLLLIEGKDIISG